MRDSPLTKMKKTAANRIRVLTVDEAKASLQNFSTSIGQSWIRNITGGYSSQSIDEYIRLRLVARIQKG